MPMVTPFPFRSPAMDGSYLSALWQRWLNSLLAYVNGTASQIGAVALTTQAAAISATAIPTPTLQTGLYRVSYYARITRAASSSSSLTPSVLWTDGGVSCSSAGAAMTGNTTATTQSGSLLVRADTGTTIRYSTTYSSTGATTMQYALTVLADGVPS